MLASYGEDGKLDYGELKENLSKISGITDLPETIEKLPVTVKVNGYEVTIQENETVTVAGEKTDTGSEDPIPPPVTITKTVEELKAGEFVNYIDKNGNTIECVVIHDKNLNFVSRGDAGVQIIPIEPLETLNFGFEPEEGYTATWSTSESDFLSSLESCKSYFDTLKAKAMFYLNDKVAISSRCLGSDPYTGDLDPEYGKRVIDLKGTRLGVYLSEFTLGEYTFIDSNAAGKIKDCFRYDGTDVIWYAMSYNESDDYQTFNIPEGRMNGLTGVWSNLIDLEAGSNPYHSFRKTGKFVPIFTLIESLEVKGEGTEENPFELQI